MIILQFNMMRWIGIEHTQKNNGKDKWYSQKDFWSFQTKVINIFLKSSWNVFMHSLGVYARTSNIVWLCMLLRFHYTNSDQFSLVFFFLIQDYLPYVSVGEVQLYMKSLFQALSNVHSHHVIHRDIKPSNFLYHRETRR